MKPKIDLALRILTGLILVIFGANKFLQFMPPPPDMTPEMVTGFTSLMGLKFIMPTVAIVEILVGASLLSNLFTRLTLVMLVPISYSIVAFHLAFDPAGIGPAAFIAILNAYLLLQQKAAFKEVLSK